MQAETKQSVSSLHKDPCHVRVTLQIYKHRCQHFFFYHAIEKNVTCLLFFGIAQKNCFLLS